MNQLTSLQKGGTGKRVETVEELHLCAKYSEFRNGYQQRKLKFEIKIKFSELFLQVCNCKMIMPLLDGLLE
jgi:hypothetical protein